MLRMTTDYPVTPQEAKPVYAALAGVQLLMALPHFLSPELVRQQYASLLSNLRAHCSQQPRLPEVVGDNNVHPVYAPITS
jgi:hypothetical protein